MGVGSGRARGDKRIPPPLVLIGSFQLALRPLAPF